MIGNIEAFLGLPKVFGDKDQYYLNPSPEKDFYCLKDIGCLTGEKGRPHPEVSKKTETELRQFFAPHNQKLYDLVGYDFGWSEE